jgi:hypothetical protein
MIEHIVLVEIPESAETSRQEIIDTFCAFSSVIPGVVSATCGSDFSGRCPPYSVAAVIRIDSRAALDVYQSHPAHRHLIALFDELGCNRIVADYEV